MQKEHLVAPVGITSMCRSLLLQERRVCKGGLPSNQ